jgi:hypothetical protein
MTALAHKVLSVKQFLAQKSITEMEHSPFLPDLALDDWWLLQKKSALKGQRFQVIEDTKNTDNGTESYSTTGSLKLFPLIAASLGQVHSCSRGVI